jgi:hypothetical protein
MADYTTTLAYAQANWEKLVDWLEAGTYDAINLQDEVVTQDRKTQNQSFETVAKIVTAAVYDAADVGEAAVEEVVPQMSVRTFTGGKGAGGLYRIVKNMRDGNATTDPSEKALHIENGDTPSTGSITALAPGSLSDGDNFTLDDGVNPAMTFYYDVTGGYTPPVSPTNIEVDIFTPGDVTASDVADTTRTAITGAAPLGITTDAPGPATIALTNGSGDPAGNVAITESLAAGTLSPVGMAGAGSIKYLANDGGAGGNDITITVNNGGALAIVTTDLDIVITLDTGVTDISDVVAAWPADAGLLVTPSLQAGVDTSILDAMAITNLAGGAGASTGETPFYVYMYPRTRGEDPRVALVSQALATAIGL